MPEQAEVSIIVGMIAVFASGSIAVTFLLVVGATSLDLEVRCWILD